MKKTLLVLIAGLASTLFATASIAAEAEGVDIHGFISQGYLSFTENDFTSEDEETDFAFNEVGLNFGKELTDELRVGIQLFARDFGETSSNELQIDWAYADYRYEDWLGLRFGQIKLPHGFYNEIRDIDMLRNPIFLPESVYHELSQDLFVQDVYLSLQGINSRDLYLSLQGMGLYGFIDLNLIGSLSYQVLFGTQNISPNSDISTQSIEFFSSTLGEGSFVSGGIETESIDIDHKYAGNLIWDMPLDGLRLGFSIDNIRMAATSRFTEDYMLRLDPDSDVETPLALAGDIATVDYKKLQNLVLSFEYTMGSLFLMAEMNKTYKEYQIDLNSSLIEGLTDEQIAAFLEQLGIDGINLRQELHTTKKNDPWGWYVGAAFRFADWFELGGYYSNSKNDDLDMSTIMPPIDFFEDFSDICATIRFDINPYWILKLEAHRLIGEYPKLNPDNPWDPNYSLQEEAWNLYAAKMTVAF